MTQLYNTGLRTEEIIVEHGNAIIAVRSHLKIAVTHIRARFAERETRMAEVMVGNGEQHDGNGGRPYG